jgi:hypothetical protein
VDEAMPAVIAYSYYILGKSKTRIADERGLSRWQVARLLRKAHANGTVRVEIRLPLGIDDVLSADLAAALRLPVIVVSHDDHSPTPLADRLRRVTVDHLASLVAKDDLVGITVGPILQPLDGTNVELGQAGPVQFIPWHQATGLAGDRLDGLSKLVVELQRGMELPAHAPRQSLNSSKPGVLSRPTVLGVACGATNSSTVRAAVERRFIDSLVADSSVAECLLEVSHAIPPAIAGQHTVDDVLNTAQTYAKDTARNGVTVPLPECHEEACRHRGRR